MQPLNLKIILEYLKVSDLKSITKKYDIKKL